MGTRLYDFVTGYDQTSAPSGSSPTALADLATLQYGVDNFAIYVATVAALKAIGATFRADGKPAYVTTLDAWFYFNSGSSATGDDENIITPTAGSGRWLRIALKGFGQTQDVATSATIAACASSTPVVRLTGSTTTDLQGITAGVGQQLLSLFNASSAVVTLKNENGSASAANRMTLPSGADVAIPANGGAMLRYDKTTTRWVLVSSAGGSSSGGGASPIWTEADDAPQAAVTDYGAKSYIFSDGLSQKLKCAIKVPNSYTAGNQINLRGVFYANASANTVLFSTVATLIRTASDAMSSTTNQRTSTNSAVTLAGTANRPNAFTCDLTSSTGQINSTAVSAGDIILVELSRGSGTQTGDAVLPAFAMEVTFS